MKLFYYVVLIFFGTSYALAQPVGPTLIDSGTGSVEMVITGSGSPTVVFESGFSGTCEYWDAVATTVSGKVRTVRYNRAGFGRSPLNGRSRTARSIATELHTALVNAKVPPPYILVGHSAGGMYVRVFAHLFPSDIAGIVLVDPAPESFYSILARDDPAFWKMLQDDLKNAPAGARAQMQVQETNLNQVKNAWPLPPVPVISISATKLEPPMFTTGRRKQVTALQTALVKRIPKARQVEATGCGHNIPLECPSVVSQAVLSLLAK